MSLESSSQGFAHEMSHLAGQSILMKGGCGRRLWWCGWVGCLVDVLEVGLLSVAGLAAAGPWKGVGGKAREAYVS